MLRKLYSCHFYEIFCVSRSAPPMAQLIIEKDLIVGISLYKMIFLHIYITFLLRSHNSNQV